jgi:hypothetical protein
MILYVILADFEGSIFSRGVNKVVKYDGGKDKGYKD